MPTNLLMLTLPALRWRARMLLATGLSLFALAALAPRAQAAGGSVLAVGSAVRDDNDAVWDRLLQLAGGRGARVAVFTAPARDPEAAARAILASLAKRGLVGEHIRIGPRIAGQDLAAAVRDPDWIAKVSSAQAVYFSGGAQARLIDLLRPGRQDSPLMTAVRGVFERGGVVAGESAGAAVMSLDIFREPPQDVLALMKRSLVAGSDIDQGFGFVRHDVIVDQHLIRRGRIGRLVHLMQQQGRPLGLGIEEHTAVVVRGDEVEVVGHRGVLVVELNTALVPAAGTLRVQGARLSLLDHGDRFNLNTRRVTPAAARQGSEVALAAADRRAPANEEAYGSAFFNDMLADNLFVTALGRLFTQGLPEVRGLSFATRPAADDLAPTLGFEWRLSVDAGTRGWRAADSPALTLEGVKMDILPVRMAQPLYAPIPL